MIVQGAIVVTLRSAFGVSVGIALQSFTSKFSYVTSKALSGELSCTGTDLVCLQVYDGG